jgi:hypothetical protein
MARHWVGGLALAASFYCGDSGAALAQQNIGATALAHNDVKRELSGQSAELATGDPVFRNEIVLTGQASTAKLAFLDSTALAVGPISRVVLDRFVYDPSSQAMAVNLTKGVFRFTTGVLDKSAYSIATPTAAIGVRGTVLDIAVAKGRTRVTLREGQAVVCPREKGAKCVILSTSGQTASVTKTKGGLSATTTTDAVEFASLCGGDPSLCSGSGGASYASTSGGTLADLGGGGASLCGR